MSYGPAQSELSKKLHELKIRNQEEEQERKKAEEKVARWEKEQESLRTDQERLRKAYGDQRQLEESEVEQQWKREQEQRKRDREERDRRANNQAEEDRQRQRRVWTPAERRNDNLNLEPGWYRDETGKIVDGAGNYGYWAGSQPVPGTQPMNIEKKHQK
ncbi:hypothetical protein F5X96DRAFT_417346 [Biscogniauxia mediterranea]|nr:hypothetical protein F5X96DRAFT_417346 [Biscogniauxia mediterranea]